MVIEGDLCPVHLTKSLNSLWVTSFLLISNSLRFFSWVSGSLSSKFGIIEAASFSPFEDPEINFPDDTFT